MSFNDVLESKMGRNHSMSAEDPEHDGEQDECSQDARYLKK